MYELENEIRTYYIKDFHQLFVLFCQNTFFLIITIYELMEKGTTSCIINTYCIILSLMIILY
jgi:hypothetical protein